MKDDLSQAEWLQAFATHAASIRAGEVGEAVHQLRVSAGRLDVWLRMARRTTLRDDLHRIRRTASHVRDLDVLLERKLPAAFRAWAQSEHDVVRAALVEVLEEPRTQAVVRALALLPPLERERARGYLSKERSKLERKRERALRNGATFEDLHALRRSARRLRYAREWLELGTAKLKALQDELGKLNDGVKALEMVDRSPLAGELADWRAQLARQVQGRFARARAAWRKAKLPLARKAQ